MAALVTVGSLLVAANSYGPTYQDAGYEQPQQYHQPAPSYQPPAYQAPAYQPPAYHPPAYPKYHAPSSAHHTQYDNYYPKQTYAKPMIYAPAPKPQYAAPAYQPPTYSAPKPSYPAPAYGGHSEEYKAKA